MCIYIYIHINIYIYICIYECTVTFRLQVRSRAPAHPTGNAWLCPGDRTRRATAPGSRLPGDWSLTAVDSSVDHREACIPRSSMVLVYLPTCTP